MEHNYDVVRINSDKNQGIRVQALVEEICDRFNLHNYFGIFSVVADEIMNSITESLQIDKASFYADFIFEQCVGGVSFSFKSNQEVFSSVSEITELLANEYTIQEEGRNIELIFYVNGIDEVELKERQDKIKEFFRKKSAISCVISYGN